MEVDICTVLMKLYECVGDMVTELACGQLPLEPLVSIHYKDKGPSSVALLFPPCLCVMYVVCVPPQPLFIHPWFASPSHL